MLQTAESSAPQRIGNYRLEELVHRGPSSHVYRATHEVLRTRVAVKFLNDGSAGRAADSLQREIAALSRLQHPNTVHILDTGTAVESGMEKPFVVLAYLDGNSMRDALNHRRRLNQVRVWQIAVQVLSALAEAHRLGIVHRDIKPENIFLKERNTGVEHVTVTDFGLAQTTGALPDHPLTSTGVRSGGTPQYMAPELARGQAPSAASDVYAVGITLYEALAGERPFEADDPIAVLFQQVNDEPTPLKGLVPVSPAFAELVHRALRKDADQRFRDASEMLTALRRIDGTELRRHSLSEFEAAAFEDAVDTVDMDMPNFDGEFALIEPAEPEYVDLDPVKMVTAAQTITLSTERPRVWVLSDDPGVRRSAVQQAIEQVSGEFDIRTLDADDRERVRETLLSGETALPWVVVLGDMHVLLEDPLLGLFRTVGECTRLLVSTHANHELIMTAVNYCGLDGHVALPADVDNIVGEIRGAVARTRSLLLHYDALRIALRDARMDIHHLKDRLSITKARAAVEDA